MLQVFLHARARGASLIEVVTVTAILAAVLSVAFPLIETANESARRHHCVANLKQIIHGVQCHEELRRTFPGGGITPWPQLEDYIDGAGRPYGSRDQGLGWMYQIAPYVDDDLRDTQLLRTSREVGAIGVPTYFCPSRRPVTFNAVVGLALNDYAAAVPTRTREQMGELTGRIYWPGASCEAEFWGGLNVDHFQPRRPADHDRSYGGFWGVVVRSDLYLQPGSSGQLGWTTGFYQPISIAQLTDGVSRTLVVSEKRVAPDRYDTFSWHDDRGWTDGWDPDVLRSSLCQPAMDGAPNTTGQHDLAYSFGSAHPRGINAAFADGSVRPIHYGVDRELLNRLAHRSDGQLAAP